MVIYEIYTHSGELLVLEVTLLAVRASSADSTYCIRFESLCES